MSKRVRFFGVAFFLGLCLWATGFVGADKRLAMVSAVAAISYVLTAWVLFEDLKGWEWITLLILPVLFTFGAGLFMNLIPTAVPSMFGLNFQIETSIFLGNVVRLLFSASYVLGMYAILLTENIFSVASIRTIQLFRAARSVNFIMVLVTALFFFTVVFSLKLNFLWIMAICGGVSLLLSFASFWSIDLKTEYMTEVYRLSAVIAWLMLLYGAVMAFWPIKPFMAGMVLTSCFYALLGILEQRLGNRPLAINYLEFVFFNLIIVGVAYLTTSWRG